MNKEILKLAKECGGYKFADGQGMQFTVTGVEAFYKAAFNAGIEAAAKVCDRTAICGSRGMAGPTCCILTRGHDGHHKYGVPMAMTQKECATAIRKLEMKP